MELTKEQLIEEMASIIQSFQKAPSSVLEEFGTLILDEKVTYNKDTDKYFVGEEE